MKNQIVNIFLILLVAFGVFTIFWRPARSPSLTSKLNASSLISHEPLKLKPTPIVPHPAPIAEDAH